MFTEAVAGGEGGRGACDAAAGSLEAARPVQADRDTSDGRRATSDESGGLLRYTTARARECFFIFSFSKQA